MGNYTQCMIDNLVFGISKNSIDPEFISLFDETDKVVLDSVSSSAIPPCLRSYSSVFIEEPSFRIVYYETPLRLVRDRLDVMGYTLSTSRMAFQNSINLALEAMTQHKTELENDKGNSLSILIDLYDMKSKILKKLTPELWSNNLKSIQSLGLKSSYFHGSGDRHDDENIDYMLSNVSYGYPGSDNFVPLRLAIEAFNDDQKLIYDLTDVIGAGYFEVEDDFLRFSQYPATEEYPWKSKIIVLTEGKSDSHILRESMNLLYPHLTRYFSFLDFENTEYGGGVGNLINTVKAFSGPGIVNNVIALFDNDTAAQVACSSLQHIQLPPNIIIRKLPEIELLNNYPTIGPNGNADLNVNGIAGSIELYLGEDVLKVDGKNLTPVLWTGYDKKLKEYQGEVKEKRQLHSRFRKKLETYNPREIADWEGLRSIFKMLFKAFEERNRYIIMCNKSEQYYAD